MTLGDSSRNFALGLANSHSDPGNGTFVDFGNEDGSGDRTVTMTLVVARW